MKYQFYLVFLLLLLLGCSNVPKHCEVARSLMSSYAREVKVQEDLMILSSGGSLMGDIKQISFDFVTVKQLDVASARNLYINSVNKLIYQLNNNQQVKQFLHNYPANINNVEITIAFYQPNGKRVDEKYVAFIFMTKNRIYYQKWKDGEFKDLYEETYEEALQKVCGK